ncbi:Major facilitator superfamily MFS-1 [mine drainage metagenome]|uniref:Major facilitator superfamily MFS-1 n=1 Tax=mine drainage metagenome TaxID=410659 RepID=T1AX91_9ZZZZ
MGGLLADRLGRRPLFLAALSAEAVSILGVALGMMGDRLLTTALAVAATGLAGSIGGPAISAYVADFTVGSDRTVAYTWQRVGHNAGFTLGVLTGGALIGIFGFVITGLSAGAVLIVGVLVFASRLDPSPFDAARRASRSRPIVPTLGTPPIAESLRTIRRDRPFLELAVGMALLTLVTSQWGVTFPLFVNTVLGVPYLILGIGLSVNGIVVVFGQPPTTRTSLGHRHTSLALVGLGCYAAAFLWIGALGYLPDWVVAGFLAGVFLLTIGENLISIPYGTLPSNLAPPTEVGAYNGAFTTLVGVGGILAPLFGGAVLGSIPSPELVWLILIGPSVPAALLIRRASRSLPARANRA